MEKVLTSKEKAKQIHKRFKACSFDSKVFNERFCPSKKDIKKFDRFIEDINLHNRFFGYLARIELV